MLLIPLFLVVTLWYLVICWKWKRNIFDHVQKLPGAKWYPFVGTSYVFSGVDRKDVLYRLLEIIGKYRPLFRSWNGSVPEINLMKPEHLQVVMRSSAHITKGMFYDTLFPWLGEGLFISEDAKWFIQRKLLTPAFHFKILDGFMEIFEKNSKLFVDNLAEQADGDSFNIAPTIASCAMDMICETSMGVAVKDITDDKHKFINSIHTMTELAIWRFLRPYAKWDPIFHMFPQGKLYQKRVKELHEFSNNVIAHRKNNILKANDATGQENDEDCSSKVKSFLDLIIEASGDKNIVNDTDLRSLVDTFIFAGFETTATSAGWTTFLLGNNPDIQEKVFQEVSEILKDKPTPTTLDELNQMKYLERVVKESLRLYPVLPFITRRLTEDIKLDDYNIPAGCQAILHIAQVHRDPEQYPEPNKFDPDRFLPENMKTRHPFAYIPFSAGPRNCIGQKFAMYEEKAILASLVKNYKIISTETPEEKRMFAHVLLRPQNGINVKLETRCA